MNSFNRILLIGSLAGTGLFACNGGGGRGSRDADDPGHSTSPSLPDAGGVSSAADDAGGAPEDARTATPPPVVTDHPPCVFSADCPAGQHCDLGECVQECNADMPCPSGEVCSPRARCLGPDQVDEDPAPVTERNGTVTADPTSMLLTDRDDELVVHLSADSADPVRYRVQIDAPYLSLAEPRGAFTGSGELRFSVDSRTLEDAAAPGTVKVFTTLGDLVLDLPMQVGVTGTYQGALTYDGGDIPLGSVGIALDLEETNGDVLVEVDPDRSMLFPRGDAGPTTGRGSFTLSDGIEFSLADVRGPDFGGARNHFRRPLGRVVHLHLKPGDRGMLEGTFDEKLYGLFSAPVTLTGRVHLERRSVTSHAAFADPPSPVMPVVDPSQSPRAEDFFPGWTDADCVPMDESNLVASALFVSVANYRLDEHLAHPSTTWSDPMADLAEYCRSELGLAPANLPSEPECAIVPHLACGLRDVASATAVGPEVSSVFGAFFAQTLAPAVFAAQDDLVQGVRTSFLRGLAAERTALDEARGRLEAPTAWVLQPKILDYFARVPMLGAPGADATGEAPHVRALRTLSRVFYVLSTIDGESANVGVTDTGTTRDDRVREAQERGVLTLFEAATVMGVLSQWGDSAPPDVGTEFMDVLSPMDRGYRTLLQGALVFGVPEGYIPFLDRAGDQSTNFERVLASIQPALDQFAADEAAFTGAVRTYEQNADQLEQELLNVQIGLESQILDLCGPGFAVDSVGTDADWAKCGADDGGEVGALILGIRQANEKLRSAHGRITSMKKKIDIEWNRIKDVKEIRDGTIAFIEGTGSQLEGLVMAEGIINMAEKALEVASNANLWNAGAPAGMAVGVMALEMGRTAINVRRQELQTAQEVEIRGADSNVEIVNGMAAIKSLIVDMAQLDLEMHEDVLGVLQAEIGAKNSVDRAKRLAVERTRTLVHEENSPLGDPTFRLLADRSALLAIHSRAEAQRDLYLAGRALEYELNQPLGDVLGRAVFNVYDSSEATRMKTCFQSIASDAQMTLGTAQAYTTELSLRKVLGIAGPRRDAVTGAELSEGEQFRQILLRNENLDGHGGVGIQFTTDLEPGNGLWPSNVCDDKVTTVEAQIVGDFLGDNDAQVELSLDGGGVLRRCDSDDLVNWSTAGDAVVQAGVNTYGTASPNASLRGLSVASAEWSLFIPGPAIAPANADVALDRIDDIVLRIHHEARPVRDATTPIAADCLADVGAGR